MVKFLMLRFLLNGSMNKKNTQTERSIQPADFNEEQNPAIELHEMVGTAWNDSSKERTKDGLSRTNG